MSCPVVHSSPTFTVLQRVLTDSEKTDLSLIRSRLVRLADDRNLPKEVRNDLRLMLKRLQKHLVFRRENTISNGHMLISSTSLNNKSEA